MKYEIKLISDWMADSGYGPTHLGNIIGESRQAVNFRRKKGWYVCEFSDTLFTIPPDMVGPVSAFLDSHECATHSIENGCILLSSGDDLLIKKVERV